MIDTIKIYGERNSGTRYMRNLIVDNIECAVSMIDTDGIDDAMLGWKHGFPMLRPNTLYIIMLRPIFEWLPSMYSYPYECHHIKNKSSDFRDFVTRRFYSSNRSGARNYAGEFKNILHARWQKYQAYFDLFDNHKNVVMFNIEALKCSPDIVPNTLGQTDYSFAMTDDHWRDIETSVADPKEESRTRSDRYEMTHKDQFFIDDLIGKNKKHNFEARVESVSAIVS